jgi:hypothetical protein
MALLLQILAKLYFTVLEAKIFTDSINQVSVNIALGLFVLIMLYIIVRAFFAWFDRHKHILVPALLGMVGWLSYIQFLK